MEPKLHVSRTLWSDPEKNRRLLHRLRLRLQLNKFKDTAGAGAVTSILTSQSHFKMKWLHNTATKDDRLGPINRIE